MRHDRKFLHHHPHKPALKLERWHRRALYTVTALLLASGLLWLYAHFFLRTNGEYAEIVHPAEPWSMKLHGGVAMIALFLIGSLLHLHIRRGLRNKKNLISGISMLSVFALLTLSGYGLYYFATEENRPIWSVIHWLIGLSLPCFLIAHIWLGRRAHTLPSR